MDRDSLYNNEPSKWLDAEVYDVGGIPQLVNPINPEWVKWYEAMGKAGLQDTTWDSAPQPSGEKRQHLFDCYYAKKRGKSNEDCNDVTIR